IIQQLEAATGSLAGKRVLDFGSGVGNLCKVLLERGALVDATEPDPNARAAVTSELQIDAYTDLAELRAAKPSTRYDVITMFDVWRRPRCNVPISTVRFDAWRRATIHPDDFESCWSTLAHLIVTA